MADWKCTNCGYTLKEQAPPEKCPGCEATCQFVDVTNYVPDQGQGGIDPRLGQKSKTESGQDK